MFDTLDVPLDTLEQALLDRQAEINRRYAELRLLLRRLGAAQVHAVDGSRSLLEWSSARLDVTADTARLLVRATKAVPDRPDLPAALRTGTITLERAVETATLAAAGADDAEIDRSFGLDLAGVRRLRSLHRRLTRGDEQRVYRERFCATQITLDGTAGRFWGQLPGFELSIFERALERRADRFRELPGATAPAGARRADALVSIAQDTLDPRPGPAGSAAGSADPGGDDLRRRRPGRPDEGRGGSRDRLRGLHRSGHVGARALRRLHRHRRPRRGTSRRRILGHPGRPTGHAAGGGVARRRMHHRRMPLPLPAPAAPRRTSRGGRRPRSRQPRHAVLVPPPPCGRPRRGPPCRSGVTAGPASFPPDRGGGRTPHRRPDLRPGSRRSPTGGPSCGRSDPVDEPGSDRTRTTPDRPASARAGRSARSGRARISRLRPHHPPPHHRAPVPPVWRHHLAAPPPACPARR